MMKNFREYYVKQRLLESPYNTGFQYSEMMDNRGYNKEETVEKLMKYKHIGTYTFADVTSNIYENIVEDLTYYYVVNGVGDPEVNNYTTVLYLSYRKFQDGIQLANLWQFQHYRGLFRYFFFGYMLPKFGIIYSDSEQTQQGENCWRKMLEEVKTKNIHCGIFDILQKVKKDLSVDEILNMSEIWEDSRYLIWIAK